MPTKKSLLFLLFACCVASGLTGRTADWPTFMHDNHRSGVTSESLRPPLQLNWVFESPFPPAAGWALPVNGYGARKNKPNVSYDDAFRVIAVGDTCYFCSSAENRVFAIDAASGTVKWSFFTDGAPRLAPAFWNGKLFVAADDGIYRCLDSQDGTLLWQVRAAPHGDLVLGQGRFSSTWPIRAAGIVEDGVAYFTAGLFPSQHVYLYAVDAENGSLLWCRQIDDGGRLDHVPQGHMLAMYDSLWTTSRTAPARWRLSDGQRIDFQTPFPQVPKSHEYRFYNGGSYGQIYSGRNIVYGRACMLAYDPDGELKDRWGRTQKGRLVFNWFNARQVVFQKDVACVATDYHLLAVPQDKLAELSQNECREFEEAYKSMGVASYLDHLDRYDALVQQWGEDHPQAVALKNGPLRWGADKWQVWQQTRKALFEKIGRKCSWMTPLKATEALIMAGDVLFAGSDDGVVALDAGIGKRLWSFNTDSRVRGLAVANGYLHVSCVDGTVRCFAQSVDGNRGAIRVARRMTSSQVSGRQLRRVEGIMKHIPGLAPTSRGYGLILGAEDASLATMLLAVTDLHIELLVADAANEQRLREDLAAQGLYGSRICVRRAASSELPYPPYIFNLVIDQGSFVSGKPTVALQESFRVTKPCGGVMVWGAPNDSGNSERELQSLIQQNGTVQRDDDSLTITRGRIPSSSDWTHNYANAANTYCSDDPHVKGPFGLLWYGEPGPRKRIDRHATPPMPLVVDGVVFTIGNDLVMAYDAYNGVVYWEQEIAGAARQGLPINTSNLAADEASLFVALKDGKCWRLDAQTGVVLQVYAVPSDNEDERSEWAWIANAGNLLYGSRAEFDTDRRRPHIQTSAAVFALDKNTGKTVWTYDGRGIDHDGIAVADGKVFFADRVLSDAERKQAIASSPKDETTTDRDPIDRRGQLIPPDLRKLVALDALNGQKLWQQPLDVTDVTLDDTVVMEKSGVACMVKKNVVVVHGVGSLGHPHKEFLAGQFDRRALYAFDVATGNLLWGGRKGYRKRPIIVGEHVYAEPFAWHLKTGQQKTVRNPLSGLAQPLDFHRGYIGCGHLLASASTLFGAKSGVSYCNLEEQCGFTPFNGVGMACGLCAVPAAGVFVVPEGRSGCTCDVPIHASLTMYPRPEADAWSVGFDGGRAEVSALPVQRVSINLGGPGYREDTEGNLWIPYPARVGKGLLGDWLPTYQHNASMCYRMNEPGATVNGTDSAWIYTSGYAHDKPLRFRLLGEGQQPGSYKVKLLFAEPRDIEPGQRLFSVQLQGETVLQDFDVAAEAGGFRRAVVKEFPGIAVQGELEIQLSPSDQSSVAEPVLCGFEAIREPDN